MMYAYVKCMNDNMTTGGGVFGVIGKKKKKKSL